MKKLFTLFALVIASSLNSQSSLNVWALTPDQSATTTAVGNGDTLYYAVTSNTTLTVFFQFQNMSASSHTYSVRRTDIVLNKVAGSHAFFCFGDQGSCYPANTTVVTSDFATLGPGQATTQNSGPPFHADTNLSTDMQDSATATYALIKYKLFDVTTGENGPDTLSFKIMYNQILGVKENASVISKLTDVYPNPSTNTANITVVLADEVPVKIQVYNSLGSVIYNGAEHRLNGENKLTVDCSNFNSGLYFITVTAGDSKITKRLVVNK
jgi:hypothetical protein